MKPHSLFLLVVLFVITACDLIVEQDISAYAPQVVAPQHKTTMLQGDVTFSWNRMPDADRYRICIVTPSFRDATRLLADTVLTGQSYTHPGMTAGEYEWRITAHNFAYNSLSQTYGFTLETEQLPAKTEQSLGVSTTGVFPNLVEQ